jgi:hypothetical protein
VVLDINANQIITVQEGVGVVNQQKFPILGAIKRPPGSSN